MFLCVKMITGFTRIMPLKIGLQDIALNILQTANKLLKNTRIVDLASSAFTNKDFLKMLVIELFNGAV